HPFMPFITEELWALSAPTREELLVHADWPTCGEELVDAAAETEIGWVIDLIEKVRSVRGEMNVPAGTKTPLLKLSLDAAGETAWTNNESMIMRQARIEALADAEAAPKGSATIAALGGTFALPLEGLIDVAAERARLERTVGKLEKELAGLQGRLNNSKFRENAAEDVIAETEDAASRKAEELGRFGTALGRLRELD
ncbi:MAG: class I tRNA ligase family protein, partial [Boseongicola sp. SB0677_bin_26]|nr:class I tRNA ligase family protein [Boseongicola sp. SB0677_bin_26]